MPTLEYLTGLGGEQVTELAVSGGTASITHTNVFIGGKLQATYEFSNGTGQGLHFALADMLGTKRVQVTPKSPGVGVVELQCMSLPFGNSLGNPRITNCVGSGLDATEHHFTGKERDAESGNDYFGARYYASSMGRFMSPDWSAKVEPVPYSKLDDPQTLNLYAYVGSNPANRIDPDGHDGFHFCSAGSIQICGDGTTDGPPQLPHPVTTVTVSAKKPSAWSRLKSWFSGTAASISVGIQRWGRLGGPAHRAAVEALSNQWGREGYDVDTEHPVKTPNGAKAYRFVDVHGQKTNADGSTSEKWAQIGRTYADRQTPVAREQSALDDLEQVLGVRPQFYDYQQAFPSEGGLPGWPVQAAPIALDVPVVEEEPVIE